MAWRRKTFAQSVKAVIGKADAGFPQTAATRQNCADFRKSGRQASKQIGKAMTVFIPFIWNTTRTLSIDISNSASDFIPD
jgi:hypothetical protein